MALTECGECKGKVSDTADKCPHCGAPVAKLAATEAVVDLPAKKGGVLKWVLGVPVGAMVLFLAFGAFLSRNDPPGHLGWEDRVKRQLIDPDSARFSSVEKYDNGAVCGYVNSKNRMGGFVGDRGFLQKSNGGVFMDDGTPVGHGTFVLMRDKVCRHGPEPTFDAVPPSVEAKPSVTKQNAPVASVQSKVTKLREAPVSGKQKAVEVATPEPAPAPVPPPPPEPVRESKVKGWPAPPTALDGN